MSAHSVSQTFLGDKMFSFFTHFPVLASLCERLRTHKVFAKDQCSYLNYHKFSINRGDSNTHPQHMILWKNIENYPFLAF